MKILDNYGISNSGIKALSDAGYEVKTITVAQNQLINYISQNNIEVIIIGANTIISSELINACPTLKIISCASNNTDNIDINYAIDKGIQIINTPEAHAVAVAELVFAHLLGMARFLHQANREMPLEGDTRFLDLKNQFSTGTELKGKTLGIVGLGTIGKEVAKIAIGLGMKVVATCTTIKKENIDITFFNGQSLNFEIETQSLDSLLKTSDFVTLHVHLQETPLIGKKEIELMKAGAGIINTSQGGVLDEIALINGIEAEKIKYAALDVFETEPKPEIQLLMNPELSLTPHIAGETIESKQRIEDQLIAKIILTKQ
jgi:D-3-phosphoglycerate dehydrogenase